jgi:23S rRNA (cytosine1962-C5)-methyltransferase
MAEKLAGLRREGTDCYRLLDARGLVVEVFGPVAILQEHVGRYHGDSDFLRETAERILSEFPEVRSIYRKRFVADRTVSTDDASLRSPEPFAGVRSEPVVIARENGLAFRIRPYDGYSVGLFLDQRDHRRFLAEALSTGRSMLNLFGYTGGFSVYAAARGAQTDTIDLSKRYLEWARENFAENGIALGGHRFLADNAVVFVRRAAKRPKRYDLVVIDPPSFSRSKEGTFRVRQDLPALARQASELLAPGGRLFVSSNHEAWPLDAFEAELSRALEGTGLLRERLPDPPFDFADSVEPLRAALWRYSRIS